MAMVNWRSSPQRDNARLYTIIAATFGVVFLAVILGLVVAIPNPSLMQRIAFLFVMALAGGGVATTMSGMLNVNLTLGGQVSIGAAGALAVFVLGFLVVPPGAEIP
jgi:hypothetical protein